MTSSSTVGTGRRYRLSDHGRKALEALLERGTLEREGKVLVAEGAAVDLPDHWVEPVGLDMAEPEDGAVVRVTYDTGEFYAHRQDGVKLHGRNWHCTFGGSVSFDEICAHPGVSITVLVPRDDDLRERLAAIRAAAAEKATNLTERNMLGAAHAYYRDLIADLLDEPGWSINGRRDQEG